MSILRTSETFRVLVLALLLLFLVRFLLAMGLPLLMVVLFPLAFFFWFFSSELKSLVNANEPGEILVSYIIVLAVLAMFFAFMFLNLEMSGYGYLKYGGCDDSFREGNFSSIDYKMRSINYYYFSIVTITTLGYGDICPMGKWFRILAGTETLFGLTISVVLIGLIVGKHFSNLKDFNKPPQSKHRR